MINKETEKVIALTDRPFTVSDNTPASDEDIESVEYRALKENTKLKSPVLTALLTINNEEFEVGTLPDRFITTIDSLYEQNPHGKFTIEELTRAYNQPGRSVNSSISENQIEEMRTMIDIYRTSVCVFSYGDEIITTVDNHLIDVTRETKRLRINNNVVDEYYYIHRPSLVKLISEQHPSEKSEKYVNYVRIPCNWLNLGFRSTPANNALIYLLSKIIATHTDTITLDNIYKAANATTPKQQLDTRRKVEKLLDLHRDGHVKTPLYDYTVSTQYGQTSDGLKDPAATTIDLQYNEDE